jgi:peptidoglycan/LPS O-acetylase OafA/YrhL
VIFTLHVGHVPSESVGQLSAISYVRQILLVQLWFQPYFDGSSWDGPAWSISAEWLAYLLFGVLVLVIFRMAQVTRARSLIWLGFAASLPPVLLLLTSGQFYTPWSWLPRIVMQFIAGALVSVAVRRLRLTDNARLVAGSAATLLLAAVVGLMYVFDAYPITGVQDSGGLVDVLFVPLVMTLAIGTGGLAWLLSTRVMVFGGQISFCLYMVHELVHTSWIWTARQFELTLNGSAGKLIVVGLLAGATGAAAVLFHAVEEPARRWMRRLVDVRNLNAHAPAERSGPSGDVVKGRLQSIDGSSFEPREPLKAMSVRAG